MFTEKYKSSYNNCQLLKKKKKKEEKTYIYILALEVIIITQMCISHPLGKTWPWRYRFLCKEYVCNLQDTFRLIGRAITMTS